MSDNKIEINFSILDNLHNFEHYTYMTQMVIKSLFINSVNYASDNLRDGHEPCDIKYKKLCPCLHGAELFYLMSWGEACDREKPEVFEGRKANGDF